MGGTAVVGRLADDLGGRIRRIREQIERPPAGRRCRRCGAAVPENGRAVLCTACQLEAER